MESNSEYDPSADLNGVAHVENIMAERTVRPAWTWIVLGLCLGLIAGSRALSSDWEGLATTLALVGCVGMVVVVWWLGSWQRRSGVRARLWGGSGWFFVVLSAVVVVGVVLLWPRPEAPGWHPGFLIAGVVVAVVYALGGIIADRLRVKNATQSRP